jgi:hypothetical protein
MIQVISGLRFHRLLVLFLSASIVLMNLSCRQKLPHYSEINQNVELDPDYTSISIPPNIAPLNFRINESADKYLVRFYNSYGNEFIVGSGNWNIEIPPRKWRKLLVSSVSKEFFMDVFVKRSQKWTKYKTIKNNVTSDSIDKYLVYRLIEPGFEGWNKMGIYQRNLENFTETPVMLNSVSDGNCMNCHTFSRNNSNTMMFHMRSQHAGTVIYRNKKLSKINTKTEKTISPGVYPSWHPSGNFIAFSVNNIFQSFHSVRTKRIEVYDTLSNIIVYDVNKNIVATSKNLSDPDRLETFPSWSPDGLYLYFCSAQKPPDDNYNEVRYDLFRIAFDPDNFSFGRLDTVLLVSQYRKSISFPRISPDGKYLLYCMSDYGNFSIWHPESDLFLLDLTTGKISRPEINSNKTESFHSWSSKGRWIVFSSKRGDGLYTRPYFSYFDSSGLAHKPFILPQKKPGFYFDLLKSYNLPDFVTTRIELDPGKLRKMVEAEPVNAEFRSTE